MKKINNVYSTLFLFTLISLQQQTTIQTTAIHLPTLNVLALFSDATNDIGIDARLGKQVLRLAAARAKQIYSNALANIELRFQSDNSKCDSFNRLPNAVAEEYFYGRAASSSILQQNALLTCNNISGKHNEQVNNNNCSLNAWREQLARADLDELNQFVNASNSLLVLDDQSIINFNIQSTTSASSNESQASDTNISSVSSNTSNKRRRKRHLLESQSSVLSTLSLKRTSTSIDAIIGPSCDLLVDLIARMAAYWRLPIYSVSSVGAQFSQKRIYSTLTRLSPSMDQLSAFFINVMRAFDWHHLAIILDSSTAENTIIHENLDVAIRKSQGSYLIISKTILYKPKPQVITTTTDLNSSNNINNNNIDDNNNSNSNNRVIGGSCDAQTSRALLAAKSVARVFLLLVASPPQVREMLLCANELGMGNGEFTFVAINIAIKSIKPVSVLKQATNQLSSSSSSLNKSTESLQQASIAERQTSGRSAQEFDWYSNNDEDRNAIARQMYESLLVFAVERPVSDAYKVFVERAIDMATREYPSVRFEKTNVGAMAVALHDSLLLAAETFVRSQSISSSSSSSINKSVESELKPAQVAWNTSYAFGLVPNLFINSDGDQELDYSLTDLEPETGIMRPVATYSRSTRRVQMLPDSYIHWPRRLNSANQLLDTDKPPPDVPYCGFDGNAEHCVDRQTLYTALAIVGAIATLVALATTTAVLKYRSIKLEMQLNDEWWKINWDELEFIESAESLVSAVSAARSASTSPATKRKLTTLQQQQQKNDADLKNNNDKPTIISNKQKSINQPPVIVTPSNNNEQAADKHSIVGSCVSATNSRTLASLTGSMRNVRASLQLASEYSCVFKSSSLAKYKREIVLVKMLNLPQNTEFVINRDLLVELKAIRDLLSDNLAKFVGLCIEQDKLAIVYGFCSRGNLQALLADQTIDMDITLKYSIIGDIVAGLHFIHTTQLDFHGRLKSTNLLLDSRFTVKICDFGLQQIFKQMDIVDTNDDDDDDIDDNNINTTTNNNAIADDDDDDGNDDDDARSHRSTATHKSHLEASVYNMDSVSVAAGRRQAQHRGASSSGAGTSKRGKNAGAARFFWTAPEHLRAENPHMEGSKKGDVYSLAIVFSEIFTRREPYHYGTNAQPNWRNIKAVRRQHGGSHFLAKRGLGADGSSVVATSERRGSNVLGVPGGGGGSARRSSIVNDDVGELGALAAAEDGSHSQASRRASRGHSKVSSTTMGASRRKSRVGPSTIVDEETSAVEHATGTCNSATARDETTSVLSASGATPSANMLTASVPNAADILDQLRMGVLPTPVRPYVPKFAYESISPKLVELMESCWHEEPSQRPSLVQVRTMLKRATKGMAAKNYLDNLLERLQLYSSNLERIVEEKSGDILNEKDKTDAILYQLLPRFVADCVKRNETIAAHQFDGVTVFFSDVVGFEKYATILSPVELIDLISLIYSSLDSIINSFDVIKIETIVDQFLIASGLSFERLADSIAEQTTKALTIKQVPSDTTATAATNTTSISGDANAAEIVVASTIASANKKADDTPIIASTDAQKRNGAEQVARLALCVKDLAKSFNFRQCLAKSDDGSTINEATASILASTFNIRIGIHSGKVCAGVVGVKRPKYCLIGDTVNVASRMHTNSKANKIQISAETKQLLEKVPGFSIEPRGKIDIKGKGSMATFWLDSAY